MRKILGLLVLLPLFAIGQQQQPGAGQIKLRLKKLNVLGSVLYVAAHPDDENTRIITLLANDRLMTTGYLSMTRGDGGQNLIGPEIRDLLGLIRTQELLAARRIDGGRQFFTRANDFGFSKSAEETFQVWGKNEILSDVVRVFRQYQPDVIITRFPPDERAGHGHHTASAVLAGEAFDAAADPSAFPGQVKEFGTWQVKRLYTNTGRWWNRTINENTPGIISLDVGAYNPLLGKSYTEIAALSSSQHKSQGWGRRGERGYSPEFMEHMKGDKAEKDIFDGINTTWSRVKNSGKVQALVTEAIATFNEEDPSAIVPVLLRLRNEIAALEDGVWKRRKLAETEQLIQDCLGLFTEATAGWYYGAPGERLRASLEIVNRSSVNVRLRTVRATSFQWDTTYNASLAENKTVLIRSTPPLKADATYSDPYWLKEAHGPGMFTVTHAEHIGLPENPPAAEFVFEFEILGETLTIREPLIYKWVDPVKGELWRPFEIVPPVFVNVDHDVIVFGNADSRTVMFRLRASVDAPVQGTLQLDLPQGWKAEPQSVSFALSGKNDEQHTSFTITPSGKEVSGRIKAIANVNGKRFDRSIRVISYDHFPAQTLLPEASIKAVRINLEKEGNLVGYINGAGDDIPAALRNMGYEVWEMKDDEVTPSNLKRVDAVVFGIRAINTNKRIPYYMDALLDYVKQGGTLVMQYNTSFDVEATRFSPFPMKLSRERVTEEDSEVRILKKDHAVLNTPNRITEKDFEGWVQERGLYFPSEWDPAFEAILSLNDKGQKPNDGSLLIARYGEGQYVYTGLSFFRQLPEGVPGAYKLFANIVSLGKSKKNENGKPRNKAK